MMSAALLVLAGFWTITLVGAALVAVNDAAEALVRRRARR